MTPKHTLTKEVQVGIYENCEYVARVYADKIILVTPYVQWIGNSGGYAERKEAIRNQEVVSRVLADIADDAEDSAWDKIGRAVGDDHLMLS
jgi:hypothetical protein